MLYLANPSTPAVIDAMAAGHIGMLDSPIQKKVTRVREAHAVGATWAADNGAFSDRWNMDEWWRWLCSKTQLDNRDSCLFATAPDVVGDAAATEERSRPWLERIAQLGYKVAYVAQDGLERLPWGEFHVLFIGGSTEWKLGPEARLWIAQAIARGVPVHMGRVNSQKRYTYARRLGCSTVDGTFLSFGPDRRLPEVLSWSRSAGQLML